jgi:hypothetical protein
MGLTALLLGRNPNALSLEGLRIRFAALRDARQSATAQLEHAEAALVALRELAARAGLGRELAELENPAPPAAPAREPATRRVRALESFSTEFEDFPHHAATGEVFDLPPTLAWRLASGGLVEFVDSETPLLRVPVR